MSIFALSSAGRRRWQVRLLPWATVPESVPFSKGVAPLVTSTGLLYMPFVGPVFTPGQNNGVEAIAPGGRPLRRLLPGWSGLIALGRDGTLYELGGDSQGHMAILAADAHGRLRWSQPAAYEQWGAVMVGRDGTVYASDGTGSSRNDMGEVVAYSAAGQSRWRLPTHGGTASLAERADGTILVATDIGIMAVGSGGARLWYRTLGSPPANVETPSLAVDAVGRAYVGTGDGTVHAFAPTGALLWTLRAGGPAQSGIVPRLALGPSGVLAVTGTDGVLRLYR